MKTTNRQGAAPLQATVWRGTIAESSHRAHFAIADAAGAIIDSAGDPDLITTFRSAAKPLQAVPITRFNHSLLADLRDEELAICCASHPGSPRHAALAASVLALSGFPPDDLVCGPGGHPPASIRHGCSGNHAAILLIARLLDAPLSGYHLPEHPAQQLILTTIKQMSGAANVVVARDGCGIPTFGLTLSEMARAFANLTPESAEWERIPRVMAMHPELIGDESWIDVRLMQATGGRLIAKTGADGLLCIAIRNEGLGLAMKVVDGSTRPLGLFALAALAGAGWLEESDLDSSLLESFVVPRTLDSLGQVAAEIRISS